VTTSFGGSGKDAILRIDVGRIAKDNDISAARWAFPLQRGIRPTSLIVAGRLYAVHEDGTLRCYAP